MGLYFNFSIVLLYFLITVIHFIIKRIIKNKRKTRFKLISFKRYFRYVKIIFNHQTILLIVAISIISNSIILIQNNRYKLLYKDEQKYSLEGIVVSNKIQKEYSNLYKIKVLNVEGKSKFKNTYLYLKISDKSKTELEYGDKIKVSGTFVLPDNKRNYGGFDYSNYLKTLKIYGTINVEKIEVINKKALNPIFILTNNISLKMKQNIDELMEKEKSTIVKGLILGDTTEIEEEVQENFRTANISHILAVSGMHVSYIIIGINLFFKRNMGKRKTRYIVIILLIFYMFLTGFSPSVVRAAVMGIIVTFSGIIHRKSDIWTSLALSLLILLVNNPYSILSIGLQFSYLGTIGIVVFHKNIQHFLKMVGRKNMKLYGNVYIGYFFIKNRKIEYRINKKIVIFIDKIKDILAVTISAQIGILPVMIYHFNTIGIYVLISNLLISLIIGPIIIIGFITIIFSFILKFISKIFVLPLAIGISSLIKISKFGELPLSKVYIPTPEIWMIVLYYVCVNILNYIYSIYHLKTINVTQKRARNLIALLKFKIIQNKEYIRKNSIKFIIFIILITFIIQVFPKNLKIHFVDVGQGDCTFIVTPKNKIILIDGGGSLSDSIDVGKDTLLPYILDRGYTKIDYIFISHFDQDHVRTDY